MKKLILQKLDKDLMVCRLDKDAGVPEWATGEELLSITRTPDELSIICRERNIVEVKCEHGWKGLRVKGPLDFALTGILVSLARPLAEHGISIFVISTYDTDYLLVKGKDMEKAIKVLVAEGYTVQ